MTSNIHSQIVKQIEEEFLEYTEKSGGNIWDINRIPKIAEELIHPKRLQEQWDMIERIIDPKKKTRLSVLEIGSGFGGFLIEARKRGYAAFGIELESKRAYISQEFIGLMGYDPYITIGMGEQLPFRNSTFDLIYSTNVLEHVQNPQAVIEECARVMKPGSYLQFVIPNYGSWFEGHYSILWIPNMSKSLAKLYVRLFRKNPDYIDTLQFINHRQLERIISSLKQDIQVVSWGIEIWEERVKSIGLTDWGDFTHLRSAMKIVRSIGLTWLIIWLGKIFHWETPIILTMQKIA